MEKTLMLIGIFGTLLLAGGEITHEQRSSPMKNNRVPLGNINGSTGNVFPEGRFRLVWKNIFFEVDESYDGGDRVADPRQRKMKLNAAALVARYGLGHGFDLRIVLPVLSKRSKMRHPMSGQRFTFKNSGIGDLSILGRYELLNQMKGDALFLSIGAGVKLPTGDTDKVFQTPMGPNKIPGMQLGTGSTDWLLEVGASKILPNSRIDAHAIYQIAGKGDKGHEYGDTLQWNLGYSYALTNQWDLQLELDGIHRQKHKFHGVQVKGSGGDTIYLTPGVHYRLTKHFDISVGLAVPIYRHLNYDPAQGKGGLGEDWRLITRIGYTF